MYIGGTDQAAMHRLINAVLDEIIGLHLERRVTELHVDASTDGWISVRDDGPGISVDDHSGKTVLEIALTHLLWDGRRRLVVGLGFAPVNALSERFEVQTTRGDQRWELCFERGRTTSAPRCLGPTTLEGTTVRFRPDPQIFGDDTLDGDRLRERLGELAWLNPLLRVFYQQRRIPGAGGVASWLDVLVGEVAIEERFATVHVEDGFVDLALAWTSVRETTIRSFVNTHPTTSGTHVDGLWRGLAEAASHLGIEHGGVEPVRAALAPGLFAVVHVGRYDARFSSPTHEQLTSPEAADVVAQVLCLDIVKLSVYRGSQLLAFLQRRLARGSS